MSRGKNKGRPPYAINGSAHDMNLRFYQGYDENFLFNKATTLVYALTEGDTVRSHVEAHVRARGGAHLSDKYFDALRAELFFTALHQYEGFFALIMALFQPAPHWIYLTAYKPGDIPVAVEKFVARRIGDLTGGAMRDEHEFAMTAIYSDITTSDPALAPRWDESLANVCWLIRRMGEFYLDNLSAYNSYKHGLRVMTGHTYFALRLENHFGSPAEHMHVMSASDDSLQYLKFEPERPSDHGPEIPVTEVTKHFSPDECFFYIAKMQQMLETIKKTRLFRLRGGSEPVSINTFFRLDRDEVVRLSVRTEWSNTPASDEEGRRYEALRSMLAERDAVGDTSLTSEPTA